MNKKLYLIDVVTVSDWYEGLSAEKKNAIPLRQYYALKKTMVKLQADAKAFTDMRDEKLSAVQKGFFGDDEKSEDYEIPRTDEDGNPVLDENGNQLTDAGRKIKDEYISDYNNAISALEDELKTILIEQNDYTIYETSIDAMVEGLPDNTPLESTDVDMMDFIFSEPTGE